MYNVPFLHFLKTSENQKFSDVFREYGNETLALNMISVRVARTSNTNQEKPTTTGRALSQTKFNFRYFAKKLEITDNILLIM